MKVYSERQRRRRIRKLHPPEALFSRSVTANFLTLVFVAVDFATLYTMWNLYLLESPLVLYLLAGGFACILDVPMAIAGNAFKQYKQGLRPKGEAWLILILSVLAFLVVFLLSFGFRIETRELAFGADLSGGLVSMTGSGTVQTQSGSGDLAQLFAALAMAFLPMATSLSAFAVTFMVSNPMEDRLLLLQTQRAALQAQIARLEGAMAQTEELEAFFARQEAEEDQRYEAFLAAIDRQALVLKQKARLLLMETLSDPDAISTLTESAHNLQEKEVTP